MRLLHIDTGREMRGGQRQALLLIEALNEAGHECLLLAGKNTPLQQQARRVNLSVRAASVSSVWSLSPEFDLIHVHDAHAHTLAALACRTPFVVSRRVAFPVRASLASRWKYRRPARFLAVSRFVAEHLYAAGISKDKVDVVYDAVDEARVLNRWSPDAPAVALAASDPLKGRSIIESAARQGNIEVMFSDDLNRDLRNASMLVYITQSEGLGSAVLLAMSMGVPVIASRTGGLPEAIEDGVSGLLVENHPQQIAAAMRRVIADSDSACRFVREGRARVAAKFTKRHLLDATLQSYSRALAG